ncbi:EH domain-containing protein, N-terminal [Phytophthora cactorum]|nr:EH domain-containing protein, N-terminal [Phytophthora cactorum]
MSLAWLRNHARNRDRGTTRTRSNSQRLAAQRAHRQFAGAEAYAPRVTYDNSFVVDSSVASRDANWITDDQYKRQYLRLGWEVAPIRKDGNCLFRALSDQLYGHERRHLELRRRLVDFIDLERAFFEPFVAGEGVVEYCARLREAGAWGGHPELVAASRLLGVNIIVHTGPVKRLRIDTDKYARTKEGKGKTINLLLKHDHYSSLQKRDKPLEQQHGCSDMCLCRRIVTPSRASLDSRASLGTRPSDLGASFVDRNSDVTRRSSLGARPGDICLEQRGRLKGAYGRKSVPDAPNSSSGKSVDKKHQKAPAKPKSRPPPPPEKPKTPNPAPPSQSALAKPKAAAPAAPSRPKSLAPAPPSKPESPAPAPPSKAKTTAPVPQPSSQVSSLCTARRHRPPKAPLVVLFEPEQTPALKPTKKSTVNTATPAKPTSAVVLDAEEEKPESVPGGHQDGPQYGVHLPRRAVFNGGKRRRSSAAALSLLQEVSVSLNVSARRPHPSYDRASWANSTEKRLWASGAGPNGFATSSPAKKPPGPQATVFSVQAPRETIQRLQNHNKLLKQELSIEARAARELLGQEKRSRVEQLRSTLAAFARKLVKAQRQVEKTEQIIHRKTQELAALRLALQPIPAHEAAAAFAAEAEAGTPGKPLAAAAAAAAVSGRLRVAENRLELALVRKNEVDSANKHLLARVDAARRDRIIFDGIYKKLERETSGCKARHEQAKADLTRATQAREALALKSLDYRMLLNASSSSTSINSRNSSAVSSTGVAKRESVVSSHCTVILEDWCGPSLTSVPDSLMTKYDQAFAAIRERTGLQDASALAQDLLARDAANFQRFKRVEELSREEVALQTQVAVLTTQIETFKAREGIASRASQKQHCRRVEAALRETQQACDDLDAEIEERDAVLGRIKASVHSVHNTMAHASSGGSTSGNATALGQGITDSSAIEFLQAIETYTTALLQSKASGETNETSPTKARGGVHGQIQTQAQTSNSDAASPLPVGHGPPTLPSDPRQKLHVHVPSFGGVDGVIELPAPLTPGGGTSPSSKRHSSSLTKPSRRASCRESVSLRQFAGALAVAHSLGDEVMGNHRRAGNDKRSPEASGIATGEELGDDEEDERALTYDELKRFAEKNTKSKRLTTHTNRRSHQHLPPAELPRSPPAMSKATGPRFQRSGSVPGKGGAELHAGGEGAEIAAKSREVIDRLKKLYATKLRPLEKRYDFGDFHSPLLSDSDFEAKPQVLMIGQYSVGKTSFIEYLLGRPFPGQRVGPEPTTDRFVAVMHGEEERTVPGNAACVSPDLPYGGLSMFGTAFLNKFE